MDKELYEEIEIIKIKLECEKHDTCKDCPLNNSGKCSCTPNYELNESDVSVTSNDSKYKIDFNSNWRI